MQTQKLLVENGLVAMKNIFRIRPSVGWLVIRYGVVVVLGYRFSL